MKQHEKTSSEQLTGKFFKRLYRKDDGSYCVCLYTINKGKDTVTVVGANIPEVVYAKRPSCADTNGPCYKCRHCDGWWEDTDIKAYLESVVAEHFKKTVHSRQIDAEGKAHIHMCPYSSFQQTVWDHRYGSEDHDMTLYEEVIHDLQPGVEFYVDDALSKVLKKINEDFHNVPYFQEGTVTEDCKLFIRELICKYAVFEMPSHRMVFLWHILPEENLWDLLDIEKIMAAGANDHSQQYRMVARALLRAASTEDREKYSDKLSEINSWLVEMSDLFELTEAELKFFCIHKPRTVFHIIFDQEGES